MTKQQILEGNNLIAEFMGLTPNPHDNGKTWAMHTEMTDGVLYGDNWINLFYDSSWDYIMPVVEKISTLKFRYGRFSTKIVTLSREPYCRIDSTAKSFRNSTYKQTPLIMAVFETVVDFLKWFNEQNTPVS